MPTFRTQRPGSIRESIATLLGSSPNLTAADMRSLDAYGAQTEQRTALAEKARLEAEALREGARLRADPEVAADYASIASGVTTPIGRQLAGYIRGQSVPLATPNDDEGSPMPVAPYVRPETVTPEQERGFRSTLASTIANQLATGKSNADQLTQAGGNLLTQAIRNEITAAPDIPTENRLGHSIGIAAREPYSNPNAQGVIVNQETGAARIDPRVRAAGVGKAPPGYRFTSEGDLEVIPGGPADQKVQGAFNQDTASLTNTSAGLDRLSAAADELLKHSGVPGITGVRGKIPNVPGFDAANAAAKLQTLKAQIGFGVLQEMRNASKTGGALGAVTEKELGFLQNALAALDTTQDEKQFKESLQKVIDYAEGAKGRLRAAFNLKHASRVDGVPSETLRPSGGSAQGGDLKARFSADPAVKGMRLGNVVNGRAEVLNSAGKIVGYYE